jgi:hypothetical protein
MINQPLFLNEFQKGASENANLGYGTMLGVETYSKKGVAQLTKDSIKVSGSVVTDLVVYFASHTATDIFAQGDSGKVYRSTDSGTTWTDITNVAGYSSGAGNGLVFFDGVLYAFRGSQIEYCVSPFAVGNWGVGAFQTGLIGSPCVPFIFPSAYGFYFGNGYKVGLLQESTTGTLIDPTNAATYNYSDSILTLPRIYNVNCLSFLPPNQLMIGTGSSGVGNDQQIADLISWDTITLNKFNPPLRLFSQSGSGQSGIKQLINRNNTLYAVTAGNHAIFSTNGSSFQLVDDISLQTTGRFITNSSGGAGTGNTNGIQSTAPIFINQYPSAIAVMGNKIYTGTGTSISSLPSGYGNFPLGVWSEAFIEGGTALQCEFSISTGTVCATSFQIGALYPLAQQQLLIGWSDGGTYGIDKTEYKNFQNDASVVWIESQMFEIGTPLEPAVITTIQENIVRNLLADQTISVYWRTAYDQAYTLLETFTSVTGNIQLNNSLKTLVNQIGATKFLQLKISMATGASFPAWTPELRNVIITGK